MSKRLKTPAWIPTSHAPPLVASGPRRSEKVSPRVAVAAFSSRASLWKRWYTAEKWGQRGSAIRGAKRSPFGRISRPRCGTSASTAGPLGVAAVVGRGDAAGGAVAGGLGRSTTTTRATPAIDESVDTSFSWSLVASPAASIVTTPSFTVILLPFTSSWRSSTAVT